MRCFVLHKAFASVRMRHDDGLVVRAGQQVFAGGIPGDRVNATFVYFQLIEEVHALQEAEAVCERYLQHKYLSSKSM